MIETGHTRDEIRRVPVYEYEHIRLPFDILAGSSELREQIEAGVEVREIARQLHILCLVRPIRVDLGPALLTADAVALIRFDETDVRSRR